MSHSKYTKMGRSLYLTKWRRDAEQYVNTCKICQRRGYSPAIEAAEFAAQPRNKVIHRELSKTLSPLVLDEMGRCEVCARVMDGENE